MNRFIVKGDLSGIQDFIFNVKTKGAAKMLKRRSLYVSNLAQDLYEENKKYFEGKGATVNKIYVGGGNYFFDLDTSDSKEGVEKYFSELNNRYEKAELYPFFAVADYGNDFQEAMANVAKEMSAVKQQRVLCLAEYDKRSEAEQSKNLPPIPEGRENKNTLFDPARDGVNYHVPYTADGLVMDFKDIANESEGDKKLAALKLDVDNLGILFRDKERSEYELLCDKLTKFFSIGLLSLIKEHNMDKNIYVVFAGGDDCFLIGSWDKIIELAIVMQRRFNEFQEQLRKEVKSIKDPITFSAGIIIFGHNYPLVHMADEAEEALENAKNDGRNKVNIFGYSLSWDEYRKVMEIYSQLDVLVNAKGESRALIQRIKMSDMGYDKLQEKAKDGYINFPKVWRLKYYLRNVKKENEREVEKLFNEYSDGLIKSFMGKEVSVNPIVFPIAARLAEMITRN